MRRAERKPKRLPQRIAVGLAAFVVSLAVLAGAWRSSSASATGGRYFYCEAMGVVQADPCVAASHDRSARGTSREARERHLDCCEVGTLPSTPSATLGRARTVAPPALVAVIAPCELVAPQSVNDLRCSRVGHARWRPPPHAATQRRSELMVFLT